jgi:sulfatase modifying factor 1
MTFNFGTFKTAVVFGTLLVTGVALWRVLLLRAAPRASAEPAARPEGIEAPEGMVYVPGGPTQIGSDEGLPDERPTFTVRVEPFFMDKHPVTVAQFRAFVKATDYVTEAERFGNTGVLDAVSHRWSLVRGAAWHHPHGPDAPPAPDDHPVTQVSWNDAAAYARWAGKRLPTEVEWEHAARGGKDRRSRYVWGDQMMDAHGRHRANTWQGSFPVHNTGADGYMGTSPVGAFGETELGLTDMAGNVWEWTASWYRPYRERGKPYEPVPTSEKVQRGGSHLCSPDFCHGFRIAARTHATPETSLPHVGFRLVLDLATR